MGRFLAPRPPSSSTALAASRTDKPRQEAIEALAGLEGADVGVVLFGDADSRRVEREMLPALPPPFAEIDGRLIADGCAWGAVAVHLPPKPTITMAVATTSPGVAATLEQSAAKGLELLGALCMKEMISGPPAHRDAGMILPLIPYLKPKVDGNRLTIALGDDDEEVKFLHWFVPTMLKGAREKEQITERMNSFKAIALAMLNYEAAHKSLPAAASYSPDGKPLLSWRVHILPYLDEQKLYNEFHLDEPWDSEHNKQLIARMPLYYADPNPAVRRAAGGEGRTTYVVPFGEGTLFAGTSGVKLTDVKDGTSNTALVVEVVPERAVVWTQPEDWGVNLADPTNGVKRSDGKGFVAAYCDGSVRILDSNMDPKKLAAVLTRSGGDPAP